MKTITLDAPVSATERALLRDREHIMQFFSYDHLPAHLKAVSEPFCLLAKAIVGESDGMPEGTSTQFPLPRSPERTVALRKLLEAKDAAVRALLAKEG